MLADFEIVRAVLGGDRAAFATLVTRYERVVWATAWRVLRDDHTAADAKSEPQDLRPMTHFDPEKINEADFAAAVRRGLEDLRNFDETHQLGPDDFLPGRAGDVPKP